MKYITNGAQAIELMLDNKLVCIQLSFKGGRGDNEWVWAGGGLEARVSHSAGGLLITDLYDPRSEQYSIRSTFDWDTCCGDEAPTAKESWRMWQIEEEPHTLMPDGEGKDFTDEEARLHLGNNMEIETTVPASGIVDAPMELDPIAYLESTITELRENITILANAINYASNHRKEDKDLIERLKVEIVTVARDNDKYRKEIETLTSTNERQLEQLSQLVKEIEHRRDHEIKLRTEIIRQVKIIEDFSSREVTKNV